MKTPTSPKTPNAKVVALRRLVLWPLWWLRGLRNRARWHWRRFQDEQRCHWFHDWMVRRHGEAQYGCGAWSWRINGILCSVWIEPMRLKVYHCGGTQTAHYELTDPNDAARAMREIETIEAIAEANKRSVPKHLEAIIEAWLAKTKKAKKP